MAYPLFCKMILVFLNSASMNAKVYIMFNE